MDATLELEHFLAHALCVEKQQEIQERSRGQEEALEEWHMVRMPKGGSWLPAPLQDTEKLLTKGARKQLAIACSQGGGQWVMTAVRAFTL